MPARPEEEKEPPKIRCYGCGIPIPDPGEYPDPDALICDSCYEDMWSDT
jgi:formylmethanofuran dehydrogenase subunit E